MIRRIVLFFFRADRNDLDLFYQSLLGRRRMEVPIFIPSTPKCCSCLQIRSEAVRVPPTSKTITCEDKERSENDKSETVRSKKKKTVVLDPRLPFGVFFYRFSDVFDLIWRGFQVDVL